MLGLLVFSAGTFLFIPAANLLRFDIFLIGLFTIGSGLTLLETSANPYITKLGDEKTATSRLNFAQAFNGLSSFIAPMIGTLFILSGNEISTEIWDTMSENARLSYLTQEAQSVKTPYAVLGTILFLLAVVIGFIPMPEFSPGQLVEERGSLAGALRNPTLRSAVLALFFYVGAQVCVSSFFIRLVMTAGGLEEKSAGFLLGVYGLLFMTGRFVGTFWMQYVAPIQLLRLFSFLCFMLSGLLIFLTGIPVLVCLGALGFFMSILFPTVFSIGISELKEHTKPGSSLLIMSIIGGAVFPVLMGKWIDSSGSLQTGFFIPVICFIVVFLFSLQRTSLKS